MRDSKPETHPQFLPTLNDPNHWRLGVFYFNRRDRRLFVPKRHGLGVTLNFGHVAAWVIIGVIVVLLLGRLLTFGTRGRT
jgi:uncharacterized membrane protein